MESSRIFIRGLPPSLKESDFKKHFSTQGAVTDLRLFPDRRIGYIGYKTPNEAEKAVKYFNRSFMKMSKIGVELARSVEDSAPRRVNSQQAQVTQRTATPTSHKRKRGQEEKTAADPKLQEYLAIMRSKSGAGKLAKSNEDGAQNSTNEPEVAVIEDEGASDEEYQSLTKKSKPQRGQHQESIAAKRASSPAQQQQHPSTGDPAILAEVEEGGDLEASTGQETNVPATDDDWLRSRTSRLLGLDENDEEGSAHARDLQAPARPDNNDVDMDVEVVTTNRTDEKPESTERPEEATEEDTKNTETEEDRIRASRRLFLRNLAYTVTEDDLRAAFSTFGKLLEVHVPMAKTGTPKGFAYLLFEDADSAVEAWSNLDGKTFQGRLIHILPAAAKRETMLDDFALSKLPLKTQQQIKRKREASSSTFNWNSLYMNADAVMSSVADRLGVSKSDLLDPTSSDAAIRQAHAETHVIQDTKAYFKQHGVDLDAFKRTARGDTAILVKNFPYDAKASELRAMFEEHGKVKQFLMPPTGTIAIVEYEQGPQARTAFSALAYRKIKNSVLFLEKAPKDIFLKDHRAQESEPTRALLDPSKPTVLSASDLLQEEAAQQSGGTSTLFVRNLNFSTTSIKLSELFESLPGFISARVKTRTDVKKPGQVLSMGFGFVEFRTNAQGQAAIATMNGYSLDGHKLEVRASHKGADAAEERRRDDKSKRLAGKMTKIIIKNLPFETSKKDIRSLFGSYGQLKSVRVPKKLDRSARGFAFAEFTTPKEAESAMDALRDTHLLGRRLVLDFAEEEPEDAEEEIERMQKKVGSQINKVALQKLTEGGRRKFNVGDQDEEA